MAAAFPDPVIIIAYMGMLFFDQSREVLRECDNVCMDVAATMDLLDAGELSILMRE
ncbi:MAG: hypothetical protein SWK76_09305 [Actinomycetota bacterium]|nr:hypothetical protein [Actinomycetota bacterium]